MKKFHCKRCGSCCYPPRLYPEDIRRLRRAGKTDFTYKDAMGLLYPKENSKTGKCIFLNGKKSITRCEIYPYRPRICREYPLRLIDSNCKPETIKFDKE